MLLYFDKLRMKKKIALLTGGYTGEAEVSYRSSNFVFDQLDKQAYEVYLVTITPERWYYTDDSGIPYPVDKNDFSVQVDETKLSFDLAFIMIHGSPGEDGKLQGYFDMLGLPYTSCGALSSALTMSKGYTKSVLQGINHFHTAQSIELFARDREISVEYICGKLSLPLFVKPNSGGSSIGMTKVTEIGQLQEAIDKAFDAENTGGQVIVEEFVTGREFSQGIFTDSSGQLIVLPATEVKTTREFFDYEAKYIPGLTEEITPADIRPERMAIIESILKDIYTRLDCRGMVRIDYFLQQGTEDFYFIEINTIPGQTAQSFIPQQVMAAGMDITEFYRQLIEAALK